MGAKLNRVYDLGRGEREAEEREAEERRERQRRGEERRERQRRGDERKGKEREGVERKKNGLIQMKRRNTTGLFCYSYGYLTDCEM
jgi:hypothetical protein